MISFLIDKFATAASNGKKNFQYINANFGVREEKLANEKSIDSTNDLQEGGLRRFREILCYDKRNRNAIYGL